MLTLITLLSLVASAHSRWFSPKPHGATSGPEIVIPKAVDASHKLTGYGPDRAFDGDERTFWLVPGGQRMEMMS